MKRYRLQHPAGWAGAGMGWDLPPSADLPADALWFEQIQFGGDMSHFGDKQQEELLVKLLDALRLNRSELQLTRDAPGTRARPAPAAIGGRST